MIHVNVNSYSFEVKYSDSDVFPHPGLGLETARDQNSVDLVLVLISALGTSCSRSIGFSCIRDRSIIEIY